MVRNHPSNTLIREYWRNAEEGSRPRVVGVLASQLPSKPRPFDRLRQNLRKLCHSLQVGGCGGWIPLGWPPQLGLWWQALTGTMARRAGWRLWPLHGGSRAEGIHFCAAMRIRL